MSLAVRLTHLVLAALYFLQKHTALCFPLSDQSLEGECHSTRSAVKLVCKSSEDTHSITLEVQCEGEKTHNEVCMCKEDGCSCKSGLSCDVKENTATRREVLVYGLECLPVSLLCNLVGGSHALATCIFVSSGAGPSPVSTTSPFILSGDQSLEGECHSTRSAVKLVCKSSEDTHSITLEVQCEGEKTHNEVCMCKEDGCSCKSGLSCDVKENTATRREVVIYGLECLPVSLLCNLVGGSHALATCIFAFSGTGPSPASTTSPLILPENQSLQNKLNIILPITFFIIIIAFIWTSWKCGARCINKWIGGLESRKTKADEQPVTIQETIFEDGEDNDLRSSFIVAGGNNLSEEVRKFTKDDAMALKISGSNASSSSCNLNNEAASIKQKCGTGAKPESAESSKVHKTHSSGDQSSTSARESALVEGDYAIPRGKYSALISRENCLLPDVRK